MLKNWLYAMCVLELNLETIKQNKTFQSDKQQQQKMVNMAKSNTFWGNWSLEQKFF